MVIAKAAGHAKGEYLMMRSICLVLLCLAVPFSRAEAETPEAAPSDGWFENPVRSRSLVGHTALPLHAGEGFVGQQALAFSVAGVGLHERVSLNVATTLPLSVLGVDLSFMGGVKVAIPMSERLHVAFGLQGGASSHSYETWNSTTGEHGNETDLTLGLLPYGVITYGTGNAHASLTLQPVFTRTDGVWEQAMLLPMLSGFVRLGAHWGLAADAVVPVYFNSSTAFGTDAMGMAGVRLFGQHWSVDVGGLAQREEGPFPGESRLKVHPGASLMFHWN